MSPKADESFSNINGIYMDYFNCVMNHHPNKSFVKQLTRRYNCCSASSKIIRENAKKNVIFTIIITLDE